MRRVNIRRAHRLACLVHNDTGNMPGVGKPRLCIAATRDEHHRRDSTANQCSAIWSFLIRGNHPVEDRLFHNPLPALSAQIVNQIVLFMRIVH